MRRCSAARRSGSAVVPAFFPGAQNTPATVSPRSTNASSTALPKSLCPTMAIRITKSPWSLPPLVMISHISSAPNSAYNRQKGSHNPRNKGDHMAGRNFLFVPGPTNVPDRVLRAMAVAMEDHRSPIFPELTRACLSALKPVFKTASGSPILFPSSGTGCWEAALTNCLNPGDKVLTARFGQFSHLWADMCIRLGFEVEILETPWGEGAPVERYLASLKQDKRHQIKAVLVCQNETATGVTSEVAAVRQAMDSVKHPALLFVDSVSALASIDFRMDEWGVDVCVSGSQKGLMLPAGLGVTCVSQKALEAAKSATSRRCYFDYADMVQANATGYFPYTPSLPMMYGLRESLTMLAEEGL